jgi:polyphosphate:AMP phosphotransferase
VYGRLTRARFDRNLDRLVAFEQMLANENVLLVKLWLHLSKKAQKRRLRKLEANPATRFRVGKQEWKLHRNYDEFRSISEHALRRTNTADAPWCIIEAEDRRYRDLTVVKYLLNALTSRLAKSQPTRPAPAPVCLQPPARNIINTLDLSLALSPDEYKEKLSKAQGELGRLTRLLHRQKRSLILVFEGADAAGKGGAIRRLTEAIDARDYQVISVAAPTDEEKAHPYLWRFWRHLPRLGRATIYDRSWYGRVLVERVEGFAREEEWGRAFGEINDFEEQLTDFGTLLLKFWLAISPEEQLRRFQTRENTPYKQYKITPEDWRNRDRWASYEAAACEMVEKTSTENAPWILVEAENKEWARVKIIDAVNKCLARAFER